MIRIYIRIHYCNWVDISAGELLVPEGIICPVVSASVLTWFIIYTYYSNMTSFIDCVNKAVIKSPIYFDLQMGIV